jgi:hypothetical protein
MQLTKEHFDSSLAKLKTELKTELKSELKTEIKDELIPIIISDVNEKLQPQFVELRGYIREVTDEILLAVGADLGEHQQEITSLDERTNRLEVRMTVVEKAIAGSSC